MGAPRGKREGRWREGGEGLPASPVRPLGKGPHLFNLGGWWVVPDPTDSQTLGENLLCGLRSPCFWVGELPLEKGYCPEAQWKRGTCSLLSHKMEIGGGGSTCVFPTAQKALGRGGEKTIGKEIAAHFTEVW